MLRALTLVMWFWKSLTLHLIIIPKQFHKYTYTEVFCDAYLQYLNNDTSGANGHPGGNTKKNVVSQLCYTKKTSVEIHDKTANSKSLM